MTRGSIASILARGAPLQERLAAPDPQQNPADTTALLDRWRTVFDSATHRLFDARLASIDWDRVTLALDEKAAPAFGDFVISRLPELYRAFREGRTDE